MCIKDPPSKNPIVAVIYTSNSCFSNTPPSEDMPGGTFKTMVTLETRRLFIDKTLQELKENLVTNRRLLLLCFSVAHFGFCVGGSCELKGYLLYVLRDENMLSFRT